ncbi:hypothetical protein [Rhizobium sp. L1K21]|uniref:hypothetical protein n=1 Tax=Rhizobium sp. L1K21 TaxID=2954933 RepID=UPI0020925752|nr:hypothetical protein [Rhizobium sp. L1K21]MCO6186251.1 hypothetical protein [Rhizobium sp. L1K21]
MEEYEGYQDYFHERKGWIYGLLSLIFLVDIADTMMKGYEYFGTVGVLYPVRQIGMVILMLAAIRIKNERYQWFVLLAAILTHTWLIYVDFEVLS